jgi:PPOX class probable F420-dependent enzyme
VATLDAAAARERFAAARVARLATLTADGAPHLVPFVFAVDGDTVYTTVDNKPKRTTALARLAHIHADPRVCLLADHYADDWSQLWWARADGTARVLLPGDETEARRAVALLVARYPQQQTVGAVVAISVTRWSGWSAEASGATAAT